MVVYSFDCNYIKRVALKAKSASELTSHGYKPKLQTMDNEAPAALTSCVTENDMKYQLVQLVPPHCHIRVIGTFKEHFVAGLTSVDLDFQMHLCDILLPQS
jgi:hypothetical protein